MQRACKEGFTNKQRLPMKRFVCNGLRGAVVVLVAIFAVEAFGAEGPMSGRLVGWGWNYFGQSSAPAGLRGVTAIAAGGYHSLAMKSDGTATSAGGTSSQSATIKRRRTL